MYGNRVRNIVPGPQDPSPQNFETTSNHNRGRIKDQFRPQHICPLVLGSKNFKLSRGRSGRLVVASGWEFEGPCLNSGGSRNPMTLDCQKIAKR